VPGFADRMLSAGRTARNFQRLVLREARAPFRVPLKDRLWAWHRGFTGFSFVRYQLTEENYLDFVSDYARYIRTPKINGRFGEALNNKVVFSMLVKSYGINVPEYYCLVTEGRFVQIGSRFRMRSPDEVIESCFAGGEFVIKPYGGGSGVAVHVLTARDGKLLVNRRESDADRVRSLLRSLDEAVILEFVHQHEYSSRIFPDSVNSIRVLTMWDYEKLEPFIPFSGHRFGSRTSAPVDNASRGGLSCKIDVDTGVIVTAHGGHTTPQVFEATHHPDTGEQVVGVTLPHWEMVKSRLLDVCREMAYIPYVGWDVVITEKGFVVIEGNNYPDLSHQLYGALLPIPRVREFYEAHGIL